MFFVWIPRPLEEVNEDDPWEVIENGKQTLGVFDTYAEAVEFARLIDGFIDGIEYEFKKLI